MNNEVVQNREVRLRAWQHGVVFLVACMILVTRRPDAVFHAQFWAEDGRIIYADAYNLGWWTAIFRGYDGYFDLFPRLIASLTLLVPLSLAPIMVNLIAIFVQAAPVNLLLMARSAGWGTLACRLTLAGVYLALPNHADVDYGITNAQWLLAMSAFLVLVASQADSKRHKATDLFVLVVSGLSGPFCIFLLPIAVFLSRGRNASWRWAPTAVLAACSLIQFWCLLVVDPTGRPNRPLGAGLILFLRILGGQIYLGTLIGKNGLAGVANATVIALLICAAIAGTALLAICFLRSGIEMRLLFLFSAMVLAASLISPATDPPHGLTRWQHVAGVQGIRYWFFPTLACAWSIVWALYGRIKSLQALAIVLACVMILGIVHDWRLPALKDLEFTRYARSFEAAPAGTAVRIPVNPEGWSMLLIKH
jgi:hypothetical protein